MGKLGADPEKFFPGMPTVQYGDPEYRSGAYWRGPAWLNVSYMAIKGMRRYGFVQPAHAMRETVLEWLDRNEDSMWEYYDSRSGKGLGARQYGWTAAWAIEFVLNGAAVNDP